MRSGYCEDYDDEFPGALNLYRQAVNRALTGKRGQAFLREMLVALDALPEKRLVAEELQDTATREVCAIGSVGRMRGMDMSRLDPENAFEIVSKFGIAETMVREIEFINDDDFGYDHRSSNTPEDRFVRVRKWVESQIKTEQATP